MFYAQWSVRDGSGLLRTGRAGSGFGGIHIPRIGQEVVVDFLERDPDRPIVTGCLYNADNKPPYTLPKNATQSGLKSRSSQGATPDNFNEIRFEDKKGEEELHVQAEKDYTELVKNDQTTSIGHDRTTAIQRNDTPTIQGDQFLHVHGNLSMTVDGVTDSKNPDASNKIKSSMSVTGQHTMKASDTIDLSAPNHIKLTVGGSSITITPGSITISAGGGASISIDSKIAATAAGKAELRLDSKVNAKSADGSLLTLDPRAFIKASGGGSVLIDENIFSKSSGGSTALVDASTVTLDATKIVGTGKAESQPHRGRLFSEANPRRRRLEGRDNQRQRYGTRVDCGAIGQDQLGARMGQPAARIGDMHMCPMVTPGTPPIPHVGGPITVGCPTVLIGGLPAARVGDMMVCVGPPDVIAVGSTTVLIGGMMAARMGDMSAHGGSIALGLPTVLIGDAASAQSSALKSAADKGDALAEHCPLA